MERRYKTLDEACNAIRPKTKEKSSGENSDADVLPEHRQTRMILVMGDVVISDGHGVRYQKCGGGRRVIRRSIGGNY